MWNLNYYFVQIIWKFILIKTFSFDYVYVICTNPPSGRLVDRLTIFKYGVDDVHD